MRFLKREWVPGRGRRLKIGTVHLVPFAALIDLKAASGRAPNLNFCLPLRVFPMRHKSESALLTDLYEITMLHAYYFRGMDETAVLSEEHNHV